MYFADSFPLLLVGQASLDDLSQRVGRPLEMLCSRSNLVVEGSTTFAEDSWKRIRIDLVGFVMTKLCSRYVLTTLDPTTGGHDENRGPLATLKTHREEGGVVLFGQNLIALRQGGLEVGIPVEVLDWGMVARHCGGRPLPAIKARRRRSRCSGTHARARGGSRGAGGSSRWHS